MLGVAITVSRAVIAQSSPGAPTEPSTQAPLAPLASDAPLVPLVRGPLLAPRDGVLGVPVSVHREPVAGDPASGGDPGDPALETPGTRAFLERLPDRAVVELADGRRLEGLVAVLAPLTITDLGALRRAAWPDGWTRRPGTRSILSPSEARRLGRPGPALLLIRTPPDADGRLRVGSDWLDVRWRPWDTPYTGVPLPGDAQPRLALEARPDRPDPDDPLAWWRWVLLADELGWRPPPPTGEDERGRRMAEHLAARWRLALGRLGRSHPGVASTLRDALTVTLAASAVAAVDDPLARPIGPPPATVPASIAGWRADPDDLERTLARLLDVDRPITRLASEIVAWADAIEPVLAWPEAPDPTLPDWVVLHLANRSTSPETVRLSWTGAPPDAREIVLPPRSLCRVEIRRPRVDPGAGPGGSRDAGTAAAEEVRDDERSLGTASAPGSSAAAARTRADVLQVIDRRSRTRRIAFAPAAIQVRPPGIDLTPSPRLTLAAVERGAIEDAAAMGGLAMNARVRRRAGRWEIFVECRRPPRTEGDAVEVRLGPIGGGRILLVPEEGAIRWMVGGAGPAAEAPPGPDPAPVVARRSWADRWYARIVLPPAWIGDGRLDLGVRRLLVGPSGRAGADVTAPGPIPAWSVDPGRLRLDLRAWDE